MCVRVCVFLSSKLRFKEEKNLDILVFSYSCIKGALGSKGHNREDNSGADG